MLGKFDSVDTPVEESVLIYQSQRGLEHRATPMETIGGDLRWIFPEFLSLD
jgi:hypothetical protein